MNDTRIGTVCVVIDDLLRAVRQGNADTYGAVVMVSAAPHPHPAADVSFVHISGTERAVARACAG